MKKNNYLDRIPVIDEKIVWITENDKVILEVENKGIFNRLFQLLLKKPKVSYIHLDEIGSFLWQIVDGKKTVFELGKDIEDKFGDSINPLYERLVVYLQTLDNCKFIYWKTNSI